MTNAGLIAALYSDLAALRRSTNGTLDELVAAFPDITYTVHDLVSEGDRVAVRWTWTGTHTGAFRRIPATGKRVTNRGMAIYTVREGTIAGVELETDRLGFLQQLDAGAAAVAPR